MLTEQVLGRRLADLLGGRSYALSSTEGAAAAG
jgi:hypothetical protein